MKKNIGKLDRVIRFFIGLLLIYLASIINNRLLMSIFVILAVISIIESFIGFCGIYKFFNINTLRR